MASVMTASPGSGDPVLMRVRACLPTLRGRPGPHPGHPTAVGGLPASKPGLDAGAHDLREEKVADARLDCPMFVTLARLGGMADYDLLVLGSGPGGQKAAIAAAKLGASVALIERRNMIGGVCIQTGTIPSKTLREAVLYLTGMSQRELYGQSYRGKEDITIGDLT